MAADHENGVRSSSRTKKRGFDDEPEFLSDAVAAVPAVLPALSGEQLQAMQMAKKYCQDVTAKFTQQQQSDQQVSQMFALQDAANKQRALLLMSRIYVGSINFELGEESVRQAFQPFGSIKTINMSWDSSTMKHKGYSFVEYETAEAAQMALEQMNGVIMGGRNIKVGRPNNVPQAAPVIASIQEEATRYPRIYVASIHPDLTAKDVKSVFEAFGKVKKIELAPDTVPTKHRGWGYIDYTDHKSAVDAIASMNLFDLGGQFLRVGRALTPPMPLYPPNAGPVVPSILTLGMSTSTKDVSSDLCILSSPKRGSNQPISTPPLSAMPPVPVVAPVVSQPTPPPQETQQNLAELQARLQAANEEKISNPTEITTLQQEEEVSISGSNARLMVMQKLSRKTSSSVMVLRNMVTEEDLDEDLEDEVTSECSKHGKVERVVIYQERQGVEDDAEVIIKIFVAFSQPSEAEQAKQFLDGRWFGGRVIKADIYDQGKFLANELSH